MKEDRKLRIWGVTVIYTTTYDFFAEEKVIACGMTKAEAKELKQLLMSHCPKWIDGFDVLPGLPEAPEEKIKCPPLAAW